MVIPQFKKGNTCQTLKSFENKRTTGLEEVLKCKLDFSMSNCSSWKYMDVWPIWERKGKYQKKN